MKGGLFVYVLVLATVIACLPTSEMSNIASIRAGDDALKIAVNYIGEAECRKQYGEEKDAANKVIADNKNRVINLQTHLLSGKNGELISEQFKQGRRQSLMFSGDKFFNKTANETLTMERIRENCRRLVLSVDSDTEPTIKFTEGGGFAIAQQQAGFKEIVLPEDKFGVLKCLADKPFCTFKNINKGNRYFSLIWPGDDKSKKVSATVDWTTAGGEPDSAEITILNLAYEDGNKPQAWSAPGEPNPMPQLQATYSEEPFTAAEVHVAGGRVGKSRRVEFAALKIKSAKIEAIDRDNSNGTDSINKDMKATIEIEITAAEPIKKSGTIEIIAPAGTVFTDNSANLKTKYTRYINKPGRRTVERNYPAGKYGFAAIDRTASIKFQAPLDAEGKVTFSAKITRKGVVLSDTKDFLDKDGNANIVVQVVPSD